MIPPATLDELRRVLNECGAAIEEDATFTAERVGAPGSDIRCRARAQIALLAAMPALLTAAERANALEELIAPIDRVLDAEGAGTKAYPDAEDAATFYRALQDLRIARAALGAKP